MVIVRSFSYLSLTTGLLLNVLSVDGSAAERDAMEGVIGGKNLNPKIRPRQEDQEDDDSNESSKKKFKRKNSKDLNPIHYLSVLRI